MRSDDSVDGDRDCGMRVLCGLGVSLDGGAAMNCWDFIAMCELARQRGLRFQSPIGEIDVDSANDGMLARLCIEMGIGFTMEESTESMRRRVYARVAERWRESISIAVMQDCGRRHARAPESVVWS